MRYLFLAQPPVIGTALHINCLIVCVNEIRPDPLQISGVMYSIVAVFYVLYLHDTCIAVIVKPRSENNIGAFLDVTRFF